MTAKTRNPTPDMIQGSCGSALRVSLYACRICADRRGFVGRALAPAAAPRRPNRVLRTVGSLPPRSAERSFLAMPGGYVAAPATRSHGGELCPDRGGQAARRRWWARTWSCATADGGVAQRGALPAVGQDRAVGREQRGAGSGFQQGGQRVQGRDHRGSSAVRGSG